jgi:trans-2,3-dihydro-3-hydroxyanthranilate isomerase
MRSYRYLHLDVFTDRRFGGNQLAVFLDGRGLADADMQTIAKEMNYSESTFVLPPAQSDTGFRVRIFTPAEELPMAGHPTIGTAFALATTGAIGPHDAAVVFGLGVGPTPVELTWAEGALRFAWMTQLAPTFGAPLAARAEVAQSLGLAAGDLMKNLPVQVVSTGVPYVMVPVDSRSVVDRALFDAASYARFQQLSGLPPTTCVYFFSIDKAPDGATAYARMFGAGLGISEDPATGSAAGPLGAYLVEHGLVSGTAAHRMRVLQGVVMGRASDIAVSVATEEGRVTQVRVGGTAVLAGEGTLYL